MNFVDAINIAIHLCNEAGREDVARVLNDLPIMHARRGSELMEKRLSAVGMSIRGLLDEMNEVDKKNDPIARAAFNARLDIAMKLIEGE